LLTSKTAEDCGREKSVAGEVTGRGAAGNSDRGAIGGKKIWKKTSVLAFDPTRRVDHKPARGYPAMTEDRGKQLKCQPRKHHNLLV
jgi:hypothetical protein